MAEKSLPVSKVSRSTAGLREALFEEMDMLRSGKSTPQQAAVMAKLATSILNSVTVEVEYHRYTREDRVPAQQPKVVDFGTNIKLVESVAA